MVNESVRVLLIDDDPLVKAGLRLILGGDPALTIVAEGSDGSEAEALVAQHRPDVVLMDIRMPVMDGLTASRRVLASADAPKIIILTTLDTDDLVLRALSEGASGFLLKDTSPEKMVEAIREVAAGAHTLSPTVMSQVIELATNSRELSRRDDARADLASLSERERAIALAIGDGLTNAEIARTQFLSIATVKALVTRILEKLGASNRVQIAIKVHDAGLD